MKRAKNYTRNCNHYASLRTEISHLQKKIKQSMRQSSHRKRAKVLESACDEGSKVFWKALNEVTNKNESKKTGRIANIILK